MLRKRGEKRGRMFGVKEERDGLKELKWAKRCQTKSAGHREKAPGEKKRGNIRQIMGGIKKRHISIEVVRGARREGRLLTTRDGKR